MEEIDFFKDIESDELDGIGEIEFICDEINEFTKNSNFQSNQVNEDFDETIENITGEYSAELNSDGNKNVVIDNPPIIRQTIKNSFSDENQKNSALDNLSDEFKVYVINSSNKKPIKVDDRRKKLIEKKFNFLSNSKLNDNLKDVKNLRNKIKKCKNCGIVFNDSHKKMYYPVFDYIYCCNCDFIIATSKFDFTTVLDENQKKIVCLFIKVYSKNTDVDKNAYIKKLNEISEEGNYKGNSGHAGKKVCTRVLRKLRQLTESQLKGQLSQEDTDQLTKIIEEHN